MPSKKMRAKNNKNKTKKEITQRYDRKTGPELPEGTRTYTTLTEEDLEFMNHLINHYFEKGPGWCAEDHYFQLGSVRVKEGDCIVLQGAAGGYFCYTYDNLGQYINKCHDMNGGLTIVEQGQSRRPMKVKVRGSQVGQ